jgi:hypothetical protein
MYIVNDTAYTWGRPQVYVLGRHPDRTTADYVLCSLKMGLMTTCLTRFNASSSGQSLDAICNENAAQRTRHMGVNDTSEIFKLIPNWRDIGFGVVRSMNLNSGMLDVDGGASFPRALTQLGLKRNELNPGLPCIAEALL